LEQDPTLVVGDAADGRGDDTVRRRRIGVVVVVDAGHGASAHSYVRAACQAISKLRAYRSKLNPSDARRTWRGVRGATPADAGRARGVRYHGAHGGPVVSAGVGRE